MPVESNIKTHKRQLISQARSTLTAARQAETELRSKIDRIEKACLKTEQLAVQLETEVEEVLERAEAYIEEEVKRRLAKALAEAAVEPAEARHPDLDKAATIAIFDGILFAIENWSSDGQTAPDFDLASKAFLYPTVYEKVMGGNEDYVLKTVPFSALEVVKRGREYVQAIRRNHNTFVTDPNTWPHVAPLIADWWRNDALPLLYGARDDAWDTSSTLSLEDIIAWRDEPATRPLRFPLVFDAMDLYGAHGDAIRDTTGLPRFTTQTIDTRLEVNE